MWRYEVVYELYDFGGTVFHLVDGIGDNEPAEIVHRAVHIYLMAQLNEEKKRVSFTRHISTLKNKFYLKFCKKMINNNITTSSSRYWI